MVFILSAVLHEVLVGIPTHNIIGIVFFFFRFPSGSFRRVLADWGGHRRGVPGHDSTAAANSHDDAAGQVADGHEQAYWQRHFLGVFHHLWAAICGVNVLLRLASEYPPI